MGRTTLESLDNMLVSSGAARRVSAGVVATSSSFIIATASTFLLLPLYLRAWPTVMYGEWMVLSALTYYLQTCDFGITAATLNAATMSYARGDRAEFNRVRDTAWVISVAISSGAFLCVIVAAYALPIQEWLHCRSLTASDVRLITVMLSGSFLLTMPAAQLRNAFAATGQFHIYQWLWNVSAVQAAIITAAQLFARQSPVLIAVGGFVSQILAVLTAAFAIRWADRSLLPSFRGVDRKTIPGLLKPGAFFGISMLSTSIQLQLPVLLINRTLGGTAVALFTSTRTICHLLKQIPLLVQLPLSRELSSLAGQRRHAEARQLHRAFIAVTLLAGVPILAALYAGGTWIVGFWSNGRLRVDTMMPGVLAIAVFMETNAQAWAASVVAKNENGGVSKIQLWSAVLICALTAALLPKFQLLATPVAMSLVFLGLRGPFLLRDVILRSELTWSWACKNFVVPPVASVAIVVVCAFVLSWIGLSEPLKAIIAAALSFASASSVVLLVSMNREDRYRVRAAFRAPEILAE